VAYETIWLQLKYIYIDSEIDQPFCVDATLSLVSKALGTTEVTFLFQSLLCAEYWPEAEHSLCLAIDIASKLLKALLKLCLSSYKLHDNGHDQRWYSKTNNVPSLVK